MLHLTRGTAYFFTQESALPFSRGNAASLPDTFPIDSDAEEFFDALRCINFFLVDNLYKLLVLFV